MKHFSENPFDRFSAKRSGAGQESDAFIPIDQVPDTRATPEEHLLEAEEEEEEEEQPLEGEFADTDLDLLSQEDYEAQTTPPPSGTHYDNLVTAAKEAAPKPSAPVKEPREDLSDLIEHIERQAQQADARHVRDVEDAKDLRIVPRWPSHGKYASKPDPKYREGVPRHEDILDQHDRAA